MNGRRRAQRVAALAGPAYLRPGSPVVPHQMTRGSRPEDAKPISADRLTEGRAVSDSQPEEITAALAALRQGVPDAVDHVLPLVYGELRRIADRQLAAEPTGHTLDTSALVHEA